MSLYIGWIAVVDVAARGLDAIVIALLGGSAELWRRRWRSCVDNRGVMRASGESHRQQQDCQHNHLFHFFLYLVEKIFAFTRHFAAWRFSFRTHVLKKCCTAFRFRCCTEDNSNGRLDLRSSTMTANLLHPAERGDFRAPLPRSSRGRRMALPGIRVHCAVAHRQPPHRIQCGRSKHDRPRNNHPGREQSYRQWPCCAVAWGRRRKPHGARILAELISRPHGEWQYNYEDSGAEDSNGRHLIVPAL